MKIYGGGDQPGSADLLLPVPLVAVVGYRIRPTCYCRCHWWATGSVRPFTAGAAGGLQDPPDLLLPVRLVGYRIRPLPVLVKQPRYPKQ